jgi:hypothetical protein
MNRLKSAAALAAAVLLLSAGFAAAHDGSDAGAGFGGDFHGQDSLNTADGAAQSFADNHPVAAQDARNAANDYGYGYGDGLGPAGTSGASAPSGPSSSAGAAAASARSTGAGYAAGILVSPGAMPADAATVVAGGVTYRYANGLFYKQAPAGYSIVNPPLGATVATLPPGYVELNYGAGKPPLYYDQTYAGYYAPGAAANTYTVVQPPKGTVVPGIPKEYTNAMRDGVQYAQYHGVVYRQFFSSGNIVYAVV